MRLDRLQPWPIAGAVGVVAVFACGWFFLISPQNAQTNELNAQVATSQVATLTGRHKVAVLKKENENLAQYKSQVADYQLNLPADPSTAELLRELQALSTRSDAALTSVSVGTATTTTGTAVAADTNVFVLPVVVVADGDPPALEAFVAGLQEQLPRAVLIATVTEAPAQDTAASSAAAPSGRMSLTINMQAFVDSDPAVASTTH